MAHYRKILLAAAFSAVAGVAVAQTNGSNSPYSRYGFGLLNDRAQGFNKGMSGVGYGMVDGKELNAKNPATYASIDSLTFLFDVGLSLQNGNIEANGRKINAKNTSLDYLTMGFRLSPNLGMSVGMLPYSTIGYSMTNTSSFDLGTGAVTQSDSYSGDGGLHEVYAGVGWRPFKGFSAGVNVGYLWGELSHTVLTSFSDASIQSLRRHYEADVRTYKIDLGLLYTRQLNKKHGLSVGLSYGLGHAVNSKAAFHNQKLSSGTVASGDTILARNAFELPHTFGAGVAWNYKSRLRVGADYTWEKWADVKYPTLIESNNVLNYTPATGNFSDRHTVAVGCEYVHDPAGMRWHQLIRYRAGFSYSTPYAKVDGHDGPRDYCVSLGIGLPFKTTRSFLNISAQYERVEPKITGMITENYLRVCVGLSFNERWFMKWKVE